MYLQKVEQSAAKKGVPPQQFVDEVSVNFRELLSLLNISNDKFIRTTEADHQKAVQVSVVLIVLVLDVFRCPKTAMRGGAMALCFLLLWLFFVLCISAFVFGFSISGMF